MTNQIIELTSQELEAVSGGYQLVLDPGYTYRDWTTGDWIFGGNSEDGNLVITKGKTDKGGKDGPDQKLPEVSGGSFSLKPR